MPVVRLTSFPSALALLRERHPGDLVVAAPLGLGKPHRLLNAIYDDVASDPSRRLRILTALSLTPPRVSGDVQRRFLAPFVERHFGEDFPALEYALAQRADRLPANIEVEEFYLQSGALLGKPQAQRRYASLNYTHVARAVAARGANVLVHLVARAPDGRLSLSCNPDLTFDLLSELQRIGSPRPLLLAEVHPELPFLGGGAAVDADFFDAVIDPPGPAPRLFTLPRHPVADAEYAIGLRASALVKDGGTLQIGIGALSDALCHALVLRHTRNADYRRALRAIWPEVESDPLVRREGGLEPFERGLYGASEMVMDGFMHLMRAGILSRRVLDDVELMRRDASGALEPEDEARLAREGHVLHGGFWLGSREFVDWLRSLPPEIERTIQMTRISHVNELYGGNETLERLQRRDARFFNTCMMMSLLGAATSDALEDGQVVSGVGGQYNFVAMAHALHDSRSVLMLRATREASGRTVSNVVWSHGHVTIPRHLRDVVVTEYGVADLRDACDEDCITRMLALVDGASAAALRDQAIRNGKLAAARADAATWRHNTVERLRAALAPLRREGLLPDYPLGSDFTPVEQRLVAALGWLRGRSATRMGSIRTLLAAMLTRTRNDAEAMARMQLEPPCGPREWALRRMLCLALAATRRD